LRTPLPVGKRHLGTGATSIPSNATQPLRRAFATLLSAATASGVVGAEHRKVGRSRWPSDFVLITFAGQARLTI